MQHASFPYYYSNSHTHTHTHTHMYLVYTYLYETIQKLEWITCFIARNIVLNIKVQVTGRICSIIY